MESMVSETIIVLGYQADAVLKNIHFNGAQRSPRIIINNSYADGISSSIKAGLGAIAPDSEAALIALADQPFINANVIDQLINAHEKSKAPIILPVFRGFRGNPVLIHRSLFDEMMQIPGDIGCRSIFGLHPEKIHTVNVEDVGVLVDIDTMEDFRKFSSAREQNLNDIFSHLEFEGRKVESRSSSEIPVSTYENPKLAIVGSDTIALSLAKLGKMLKFHVIVVDPLLSHEDTAEADEILHELDLQKAGITSQTYIVIASRGKFDQEALEQALDSKAGYIALVGSKKRAGEIFQRLRANGISDQALKRVRSPAGLEIHASTPEEIALSVLAEIVSIRGSMGRKV